MTEHIIARTFLFAGEAIVFCVLSFLIWQFYRGFGHQYVKFWLLSLASLSISKLSAAIQAYYILQPETSPLQVSTELVQQVSYFLFFTFWVLGLYSAYKRRRLTFHFQIKFISIAVMLAALLSLMCAFDSGHVYDRYFLRETLPASIFAIGFIGISLYFSRIPNKHFAAKIVTWLTGVIALRFLIFALISTVWLTDLWFQYFSLSLRYFDVAVHTIIGFSMLIWMQGSERSLAVSALSKARYLGQHDLLTGSLNREQVLEEMPKIMADSTKNDTKLAIFLIDIKRFKFINDTYGLKTGDHILGEIAKRLRESLFKPLIVGRLSGDSFVYVFEFMNGQQVPWALRHLHELISRVYKHNTQEIFLQASIGYSFYPEHSQNAEALLRHANLALHHAESRNEPDKQFTHDMQMQERHLLAIEKAIKSAMANDEFELYYQPQLNLRNNKLEGVEALVRWHHPERGFLTPNQFLDDVDTLRLNSEFDHYILIKACEAISRWHRKYRRWIAIAVNITAVEFQNPQLVSRIQSLLNKHKVPPNYLELEITENVVMTDLEIAMNTIITLQNMGIKVSIDDFGTGYSSLAYLRKLPIDKIKIDRSFVNEMAENDSDLTIVKSMIKLSHGLGKRVLAEGVETGIQLDILRKLNCDAVQGYFIEKPLSEEALSKYLARK